MFKKLPEVLNKDQEETLSFISSIKNHEQLNLLEQQFKGKDTNSDNVDRKIKELEKPFKEKLDIVYVDGVFDIMHAGHFNAIRQAKKMADVLLVGVNGDSYVHKVKGPTLMNTEERSILAAAVKWTDKVCPNTPYDCSIELLDQLGATHAAHGDDIAINENGEDAYSELKKVNRMKIFKRTDGISTTNLLGRLMMLGDANNKEIYQPLSVNFITTGWRFKEFCNNTQPKEGDKIVYIDGAWDCLHPSHIKFLEYAKSRGDYLIVGVYDDDSCREYYGNGNPIMGIMERSANVLAMRYVDDIVISCPKIINQNFIKTLGINLVIGDSLIDKLSNDPYSLAKKLNLFELYNSEAPLSNEFFVERLNKNKQAFLDKYKVKSKKEDDYEKTKKLDTKEV